MKLLTSLLFVLLLAATLAGCANDAHLGRYTRQNHDLIFQMQAGRRPGATQGLEPMLAEEVEFSVANFRAISTRNNQVQQQQNFLPVAR